MVSQFYLIQLEIYRSYIQHLNVICLIDQTTKMAYRSLSSFQSYTRANRGMSISMIHRLCISIETDSDKIRVWLIYIRNECILMNECIICSDVQDRIILEEEEISHQRVNLLKILQVEQEQLDKWWRIVLRKYCSCNNSCNNSYHHTCNHYKWQYQNSRCWIMIRSDRKGSPIWFYF